MEVSEFSPLKCLERLKLPLEFPCLMAVGGDESDEFQRQGEEFHQVLLVVFSYIKVPWCFILTGFGFSGRGLQQLHPPG